MTLSRLRATPFRLIDGPLVETRRTSLVTKMAADLVKTGTYNDEREAIRSLFGNGYAMADIIMLIDDARQAAMQDIVAREMGEP